MEHDIYWERQCALIERALQSEREERELHEAMRSYRHEVDGRKAYFKLQRTKRGKIIRNSKTVPSWKSQKATYTKGERATNRTKRFPGSYVTVYVKHKPC